MTTWRKLEFTVQLPPRGQARPRQRIAGSGSKQFVQNYKSAVQKLDEAKYHALFMKHKPNVPITGPIKLGIMAYLMIPDSKSKRWKADALSGLIRPTGKPDLDNIIKHCCDVMNGIFWHDDKQVIEYLPFTGKYYSDHGHYKITLIYQGGDADALNLTGRADEQ